MISVFDRSVPANKKNDEFFICNLSRNRHKKRSYICEIERRSDAICHSGSTPQRNPRAPSQRNSTVLKRLHLSTQRQSDRLTENSCFFETISGTIDRARASARWAEPPRRETHFCSAKVRPDLNNRVTKDVAMAVGLLST